MLWRSQNCVQESSRNLHITCKEFTQKNNIVRSEKKKQVSLIKKKIKLEEMKFGVAWSKK